MKRRSRPEKLPVPQEAERELAWHGWALRPQGPDGGAALRRQGASGFGHGVGGPDLCLEESALAVPSHRGCGRAGTRGGLQGHFRNPDRGGCGLGKCAGEEVVKSREIQDLF